MVLPKTIKEKGFTLIEILLVIAILSILLAVVFAAINPARRLAETRNARRWNDVNQILTALHECIVDEDITTCGLTSPTMALSQIGSCTTGGATPCTGAAAACLDLDADTDLDSYIASFPIDPSGDYSASTTAYSVQVANGIITVSSCAEEDPGSGAPVVSVSR